MMTQLLLFNVTNGLIIGAFYVLMALGLSLILNLSNVINFAHGGFLVIGGYIAYTITPYIGFWGALLLAPPLTAIIGLAVERVLIRPLYGRDPLYSLLLTFGLAFMIEDGTRFIWGPQGKPVTIPAFLAQPLSNDLFFITGYRLFMVAVVIIAVTLLFLLLRYTRLGVRIRAGTLDLETVAALGINVRMLRSLNFAVGIFLAGLSGVLAAGQLGLEPTMGTGLLMPSFIAIIVGGIGSLPGTLAGGLLIGVASGVTAVLCGILLAGICGAILGLLIVRRRGVYFAMVTIAFGQVFYYIAFQWSSLTGGDDGLRGFSRQPIDLGFFKLDILTNANIFYYFVLFCLALAVGAMGFILRSPFGRTMIAIRENERRARFLGIPVERHIWIAFTLSCFFMGFAGALYALVNNFADPRGLHYSQSGDFVMMAVMGGMRSFWGPLLGATVFVVLQDYLSSVTVNWMSFVGLLFVLVVLFFPRGLLGFFQRSKA